LISPLSPNQADKPGCGKFNILDSAEATKNRLENQSYGESMAEVTHQWDEVLP
jgi:hypothetical protein